MMPVTGRDSDPNSNSGVPVLEDSSILFAMGIQGRAATVRKRPTAALHSENPNGSNPARNGRSEPVPFLNSAVSIEFLSLNRGKILRSNQL